MCKAPTLRDTEQNASIFGHKGKASQSASISNKLDDVHPPRYYGMPDTPNERLVTALQTALDVAGGMDPYLTDSCSPASEAASALGRATEEADWGSLHASGKTSAPSRHATHLGPASLSANSSLGLAVFRFSNVWTTDVVEAKTLAMFAYMMRARRVMEIGMFTG